MQVKGFEPRREGKTNLPVKNQNRSIDTVLTHVFLLINNKEKKKEEGYYNILQDVLVSGMYCGI